MYSIFTLVVLFQLHPRDNDRILSVVKIWDTGLGKNPGKEFELLWTEEKSLTLEKLLKCKIFGISGTDNNIYTDNTTIILIIN
jgi:predicted metallopeptidase